MHHVPGNLVAAGHPMVAPDRHVRPVTLFDGNKVFSRCGKGTVEFGGRHLDKLLLRETAGGGFHNGKGIRQDLVQHLFDGLVLILDQLVRFGGQLFLPAHGDVLLQFGPDFRDAVLEGSLARTQLCLQFFRTGTQGVIGKFVDILISCQDLVQDRLHLFHIPVGLGAEKFLQDVRYCHIYYFFILSCKYRQFQK